jgi:hypothetical protein
MFSHRLNHCAFSHNPCQLKRRTSPGAVSMMPAVISCCCRVVRSVVDNGPELWTRWLCRGRSSVICGRQYHPVCCVCCLGGAYVGYPRHDGRIVCFPSHTSTALVCRVWSRVKMSIMDWYLNDVAPDMPVDEITYVKASLLYSYIDIKLCLKQSKVAISIFCNRIILHPFLIFANMCDSES